jgi:SAM-dependent methyltransferase
LATGDTILDLACGDGGLADFLPDQQYIGVDASDEMVSSGRARGRELILGDLNDYVPSTPVQATTIFRAIYYARDRAQLLAQIAGYTEKKLVFDLNPRQYRLDDVRADLRAAGFTAVVVHPFFVPQTRALPSPLLRLLPLLERSGPIARAVLRYRFTFLCAASVTKR